MIDLLTWSSYQNLGLLLLILSCTISLAWNSQLSLLSSLLFSIPLVFGIFHFGFFLIPILYFITLNKSLEPGILFCITLMFIIPSIYHLVTCPEIAIPYYAMVGLWGIADYRGKLHQKQLASSGRKLNLR